MKVVLASVILGATALVFPVGNLAADHRAEQARMRDIQAELQRLHAVVERQRAVIELPAAPLPPAGGDSPPAPAPAPAAPAVRQDAEFRHRLGAELKRLHRLNDRLLSALGREVPDPVRHLARIGACESGSRPAAVSPGGVYRGWFQFDLPTWRGVGGMGDPAAASDAEQWGRALLLYARRGGQPWPVCRWR